MILLTFNYTINSCGVYYISQNTSIKELYYSPGPDSISKSLIRVTYKELMSYIINKIIIQIS